MNVMSVRLAEELTQVLSMSVNSGVDLTLMTFIQVKYTLIKFCSYPTVLVSPPRKTLNSFPQSVELFYSTDLTWPHET